MINHPLLGSDYKLHFIQVINGQLPVDSTGVVLNFLSDYDVPLYSAITDAMKKKVPNFNDTMRGPPNHCK